jgi:acyl carrier protein
MESQQSFQDLIEQVRRVVSEAINAELEDVGVDTPIHEINNEEDYDLMGGLLLLEALYGIQQEFHLKIPDQDATQMITVRDFANYIYPKQADQINTTQQSPIANNDTSSNQKVVSRKRISPAVGKKRKVTSQSSRIWTFDMGHWDQTEDSSQESSEKTLLMFPEFSVGAKERGFYAEVYKSEHPESTPITYAYVVKLQIGQDVKPIYVTDLPSLISLLNRLSNIAQGITNNTEHQ